MSGLVRWLKLSTLVLLFTACISESQHQAYRGSTADGSHARGTVEGVEHLKRYSALHLRLLLGTLVSNGHCELFSNCVLIGANNTPTSSSSGERVRGVVGSPPSKAGINVVQISGNYPTNTSVSVENILRQTGTTSTIYDGIKNITITDPIVGSYAWDTNSTTLNTSIVTTSASIPNRLDGGLTAAFTSVLIPNNSTAPVANELVKLTGSPATATVATTLDTSGKVLGICLSNCSAGGSSTIVVAGAALCSFDNTAVAGDWVIAGTGVGAGGKCHDNGSTSPTSGVTNVGRVLTGGSSPQSVLLQVTEK